MNGSEVAWSGGYDSTTASMPTQTDAGGNGGTYMPGRGGGGGGVDCPPGKHRPNGFVQESFIALLLSRQPLDGGGMLWD